MELKSRPTGYSASQILLHWLIALLVIYQLVFGEDMEHAYHALRKGKEVNPSDLLGANIHVYVGIAVFVLAILRLIFRIKNGAPPAPEGQSRVKTVIAASTQHILYLIIFLMPITGGIAWFLSDLPFAAIMAEVHSWAKPLIIIAVLLHVAGALMQHFVAKTDVLVRMMRPGARTT